MKQKPTIVFLSRLYHPHIGGVEKHLEIISKILIKKGYRIVIVTEKHDKSLKSNEVIDGITVYRIFIGSSPFLKKFYIWIWMILNIKILLDSDIIHVHDVFFWIIPIRPFIPKKKVYTTFHGYENFPIKRRWIMLRKIAEKLSNGTICIGDFMKKWYNANPTYVSYGGVRLVRKKRSSMSRSAVFFGRLDDQTGILEYCRAYEILRKKYPDFQFTVVGEGKYDKNIPKSVKIVPFTKDVNRFIENNRFIFVSRYLSILEALVQKKDVIAVYKDPIMKDYLLMSPFKEYVEIFSKADDIARYVTDSLERKTTKNKEKSYKWAIGQSWENVVLIYLRLWGVSK